MNYIVKLQNENAELRAEIERLKEIGHEIRNYLSLPKFSGSMENEMVHKGDIFLRLRDLF